MERRSHTQGALYLIISALLALAAFLMLWQKNKLPQLSIASGKSGGVYTAFAEQLATVLKEKSGWSTHILHSEGSIENLSLIRQNKAHLALIQNALDGDENLRVIAPLYREVVHILLPRNSSVRNLQDLQEKRIATGLKNSGTRIISKQLLEHYGLTEKNYTAIPKAPEEACKDLLAGKVDAVILVTGLHAPVISKTVASNSVRLFSFQEETLSGSAAEGIHERHPHLLPYTIPKHTYSATQPNQSAFPDKPISTLSVESLLVCKASLPPKIAYHLTKTIFEQRYRLGKHLPDARHIREITNSDIFPYSVHPGADRYFHRNDPSFLVRYAEVIALIFSLLIAGIGTAKTLRRWSANKKKNRIDTYYVQLNNLLERLHSGELQDIDLNKEEENLWSLRYRAIQELADERLTADESFKIFQTLLANCLEEIQWKKERKEQSQ